MVAVLFHCLFVHKYIPQATSCLYAICSQLSFEWCVIACVRRTGAGVQGLTSVFPVDISNVGAPVLTHAAFLMGKQSVCDVSCGVIEQFDFKLHVP